MHTRFDGDLLILVVEPGDQVELPCFVSDYSADIRFLLRIHQAEVAGWLMNEEIAVRIFGADCYVEEAHFYPDIVRLRVYIPKRTQ